MFRDVCTVLSNYVHVVRVTQAGGRIPDSDGAAGRLAGGPGPPGPAPALRDSEGIMIAYGRPPAAPAPTVGTVGKEEPHSGPGPPSRRRRIFPSGVCFPNTLKAPGSARRKKNLNYFSGLAVPGGTY